MSYLAAVLTEHSHNKLALSLPININVVGWKRVCHHMTLYMGSIKPEHKILIGKKVMMITDAFGQNEFATAVRIVDAFITDTEQEITSDNPIAHITMYLNKPQGKPKHSRQLTKLDYHDHGLILPLIGVLEECK